MNFNKLYQIIEQRKQKRTKGSYVASLFNKGEDVILKKISEETGEVIIAAKNNNKKEIIWEATDLLFHTFVLLSFYNILPKEILKELESRSGKK